MWWKFLDYKYFGNTVLDYLTSAAIVLGAVIVIKLLKMVGLKTMKKWAEKTHTRIDDFMVYNMEKFFIPLLYFFSLYASLYYLKLSRQANLVINTAMIIVFTYFAIRFGAMLMNYAVRFYWHKREGIEMGDSRLKGVESFVNLAVWGLGIVFLLDNLGFRISAVIAGLGIGGIAVALAAQAVLGDLFSYFVIFFDRPFEVGDYIVVDDKSGDVEYIGIKTTKVKSLTGEQLIFANSDLTRSRIHNFKRMMKRRVAFKITVTYQTPVDLVKDIPSIIKNIIEPIDAVTFERAHFQGYSSSGLLYETVYYVIGSDYNKYMDIQQEINVKIFEEFAGRKIEFAYPTNTVFVRENERTS